MSARRKKKLSQAAIRKKRSEAAKCGWETRKRKAREEAQKAKARSDAAKRGWQRRRFNIQDKTLDNWKDFLLVREEMFERGRRPSRFQSTYNRWLASKRKLRSTLRLTAWEKWMITFGQSLGIPRHGTASIDSYITS